jgi:ferredoxin
MCSSGHSISSMACVRWRWCGDGLVKVTADRDVCISAGNCVMVADAVFDQDDDGIVMVLVDEVPEGEEEHAREAVKLCPSQALRLAEE